MQSLLKLKSEPFYRNSASIIGNSFFAAFYGLVFWIIAARLVPAAVVGLGVAIISTAALLSGLSRLGMDDVLVRFLPRSGDRTALYSSALVVTLAVALGLTAAFMLLVDDVSPSLAYLRDGWYLPLFVLYMATYAVYTTQNTTLLAIRRADMSLVQNVLLGLRIPLLFLAAPLGALGILASFIASYLAALGVGMAFLAKCRFRLGALGPKAIAGALRGHLTFSAGNYASAIFTILPATLMPLIIMGTAGAENVAYFYVAYSIASLLFIIPNAVSMSLFIEGSHDMPLDEYTYKSVRLILAIVVPLVILLYFFGGHLLLLFNKEYSEQSLGLLRLLVISSLFSTVISVYQSVRRVEKNVKSLNKASATTSLLIIGLGYLFLAHGGLTGLGYAWILANAAVAAVLVAVLVKEGKILRRPVPQGAKTPPKAGL